MRIRFALHQSACSKIAFYFIALLTIPAIGFAGEKISVFVSIAPQKYFVQKIGRQRVAVQVMVQSGDNPATYEPKPRQMAGLSTARLYFAVGVPFENIWMSRIAAANPNMRVVHTDQGIARVPMAPHHHHKEEDQHLDRNGREKHGDDHFVADTNHRGLDPHIWLSPPLVKLQARSILSALKTVDPAHQEDFEANYRLFVTEIDRLDDQLRQAFAHHRGLRFLVFHPAWGYFARTYGIEQVPVEIEGKDPKPARLQALIQGARKAGIKVIFVQPQFSTRSARLIAGEIGGQVAFADPLAEDWTANLQAVADKFKAALK
jgi:zinc transport system substrate-binding protein